MNLTRSRRWRLRETTVTPVDVATPSTRRRRSRRRNAGQQHGAHLRGDAEEARRVRQEQADWGDDLDVVRANTFVAENQGKDVRDVKVDVIGGHAGTTIIPLLSQVPGTNFSDADIEALTQRIMFGGDEVVKAKDGAGSATLSMAYAGAHFTSQLLKALDGQTGIQECAFAESSVTDAPCLDARDARPRRRGRGPATAHLIGLRAATPDAPRPDLIAQAES